LIVRVQVACSTYCLLAVALLEEPDLAAAMPEAYPAYRTRVQPSRGFSLCIRLQVWIFFTTEYGHDHRI
jgi:hypothetical protein